MKKVSGRLANLTPEQREKLLKKLREQKKDQEGIQAKGIGSDVIFGLSAGEKPLSFSQQRLWFLEQFESQSAAYNIPARLQIKGKLDQQALERSLHYLFARHESLRCVFPEEKGVPYIKLLEPDVFELDVLDLSGADQDSATRTIEQASQEIACEPFSLSDGPLFRARLLKVSSIESHLLICMHHIISDAWSMRILVQELSTAYKQFCDGEEPKEANRPECYFDYAAWQKQQLETDGYQAQQQFWKKYLNGAENLYFPFDHYRAPEQSYNGKQIIFDLSPALSQQLKNIARKENTTLFMLLLAAWGAILNRYSEQSNFCVGTPVVNRPHSSLETCIGFFVNTLPVRIECHAQDTFLDYLNKVKQSALQAFANPDVPFDKILNELGLSRDVSRPPVFQSMFSFQNDAVEKQFSFSDLEVELFPIHTKTSKFDLSMDVIDKEQFIQMGLEYNSDLMQDASAQNLKDNFIGLLEAISSSPENQINKLDYLSEHEKTKLLEQYNGKDIDYQKSLDLGSQFEQSAKKFARNIAFKNLRQSLTFAELDDRASMRAGLLSHEFSAVMQSQLRVAIFLDDELEFLTTLLAMLKMGICYVPIDVSWSIENIESGLERLKESNARLSDESFYIVGSESTLQSLGKGTGFTLIDISKLNSNELTRNKRKAVDSETIAFQCLNLSEGSSADGDEKNTVNGKGLYSVSHRSFSNLIDWYTSALASEQLKESQQWLITGSLANFREQKNILAALIGGHCLCALSVSKPATAMGVRFLSENKPGIVNCSPWLLKDYFTEGLKPRNLSALFLQGHTMDFGELKDICTQEGDQASVPIWKLTSVGELGEFISVARSSFAKLDSSNRFNIGRALQNNKIFLLNSKGAMVPRGAWGRMHVAGANISCCVPNSADTEYTEALFSGERYKLYSTNYWARYDHDGELHMSPSFHFGAIPNFNNDTNRFLQKIHALTQVAQCVLLEVSDDFNESTAVIQIKAAYAKNSIELRNELIDELQADNIPGNLICVDDFPRGANGDLDIAALREFSTAYNKQFFKLNAQVEEPPELQLPYDYLVNESEDVVAKTLAFELSGFAFVDVSEEECAFLIQSAIQILFACYSRQTEFSYSQLISNTQFPWAKNSEYTFANLNVDLNHLDTVDNVIDAQPGLIAEAIGCALIESGCKPFLLSFNVNHYTLPDGADLHFSFKLENNRAHASVYYNARRFEFETISQLIKHLGVLLEQLQAKRGTSWQLLNLLSSEETEQILDQANGEQVEYQHFDNVNHFLLDALERNPDNKALLFYENAQEQTLSYAELHERAERLASYLSAQTWQKGLPVALCFERGVDMVVAILASLKLGSPYLPLDPALPHERLNFMLEDSQAQILLLHSQTRSSCQNLSINSLELDNLSFPEALNNSPVHGPVSSSATHADVFNLIYTSGSTGQPKGVMVNHGGILNRIQWMQSEYKLKPDDRVLQKTTYSFDVSVWEFIWPLSQGACLVLAKPEGHKDPLYLRELMIEAQVSHCHFVPSMLNSWLESIDDNSASNEKLGMCLKKVFCSGEALSRKSVNHYYKVFPESELHNLYGPTEAAIDVSYWHCEKEMQLGIPVPIGKAVANTSLYVLDSAHRVLPFGVPGELYIGGVQLAQGYLNREDLTAKSFVEKEIEGSTKQRLYKSGDLVRLNRKGFIEYLGRIDHQVKIRGYRIELGEIENQLQALAEIDLSVVIAREVGNSKQLIAYVSLNQAKQGLSSEEKQALQTSLKQKLSQNLPTYMVPGVIVVLDEMPVLNNGKINRKALPEPDFTSGIDKQYLTAETELEGKLQSIWQKVLGIESIGLRDNFFDLGGDSILSIQILSAARHENIILSPTQIFRYPTISELAQVAQIGKGFRQISQDRVTGNQRVSPIQQWFFEDFQHSENGSVNHFNQSILLELHTHMNIEHLKAMVNAILHKHDVLTSIFKQESGIWSQQYDAVEISERLLDQCVSEEHIEKHAAIESDKSLYQVVSGKQSCLDIASGPLVHFCLLHELHEGIEQQALFICAHHLVVDGVSWRILLEDLNTLINVTKPDSKDQINKDSYFDLLPGKTLSFKDWSESLSRLVDLQEFSAEKSYWKDLLKLLKYYQSPLYEHSSRVPERHYSFSNQKRVEFNLSNKLTEKFLKQAQRNFKADANDLLLCALSESFSESQMLAVNMELHGRDLPESWSIELGFPDVSRTVGWFTSLFPILLTKDASHTIWSEKLKKVKEQIRGVPAKGLSYGLLTRAGKESYFKQSSLQGTKPDISFNYLGQLDQSLNSKAFGLSSRLKGFELDQSANLQRPHVLDILVYVDSGNLKCEFLYDQLAFDEDEIHGYLNAYQQALTKLIVDCSEQKHPLLSPSDFKAASLSQTEIEEIEHKVYTLESKQYFSSIETIHDLLPTQSGMLFHSLFENERNSAEEYLEQFCIELNGDINVEHFQSAWKLLVNKHANLRSIFHWQTEQPLQIVLSDYDFQVEVIDCCQDVPSSDVKTFVADKIRALLKEDRQKGIDLSQPPLMRVYLVRFSRDQYWMLWSYHHILLDGWSVPLVLNDLFSFYAALDQGKGASEIKQSTVHKFEDYLAWYRALPEEYLEKQSQFWERKMSGFALANEIDLESASRPITDQEKLEDGVVISHLDEKLSDALKSFARQQQLTLNTLIQTAWTLLLSHYCGDDDVVFGATMSGRPDTFAGADQVVGMFINTLPLRLKLDERSSLKMLLNQVQQTQQELSEYQTSALVDIQKSAGLEDESRLFDSILVFENFPVDERLKQDNPWFKIGEFYSFEKTNYPLTIIVEPGEKIGFRLLFDTAVYRSSTIERVAGHLETILSNFSSHTNSFIFDVPYMTQNEVKELRSWNETKTQYPKDKNLAQLFSEKARQYPQQIALKFDECELSYKELDLRSNQLARFLNERGAKKGARVALFMDRSETLLISILAVVKSGAAYVPLDPEYPVERLQYMLEDCDPVLVLSHTSYQKALETIAVSTEERPVLFFDDLSDELKRYEDAEVDFYQEVKPEDLVYLMYTSGSTGQPKGVALHHQAIVRLVINSWYFNFGPNDRMGHIANVCFDASAYEIWGTLLNGATLVGFDKNTILSGELFEQKLQQESVSNMLLTTSLFHIYSQQRPSMFKKMRCLLVGGEQLIPDLARRVLHSEPPLQLLNVYGPTENGVLTSGFDIWNLAKEARNVPVGKPISNTFIYILDKRDREVPVGVIGELVCGGDGVGLGYWRKPELSSNSFIQDPVLASIDSRAYRSGDLARRLVDGTVEIIGRKDKQLKIRGFRIEPGEIVSQILKNEMVQDAVVTAHESDNGQKHLVAYLVPKAGNKIQKDILTKELKESLPQHMAPKFFIEIPEIPITPNGKLDSNKLPKPKLELSHLGNFQAARSESEAKLLTIWQEVLKVENLGVFDNFFEVGGDSIISIQIVSRAKKLGLEISPKLLFEHPTIAELAKQVESSSQHIEAEQGLVQGEVKLSPIQHWFFSQNFPVPEHFNQSFLFRVNGFLTIQGITPVLSALLKHHDVFRLRYEKIHQEWIQKHDNSSRSLTSLAEILSEQNFSQHHDPYALMLDHARKVQTELSLSKGPLIKLVLYHLGDAGQRLLFVAHHLVIDGVSWRILLDDLNIAFEQQIENKAIELNRKTTSYQSYTKALEQYANSQEIIATLNYWAELGKRLSEIGISETTSQTDGSHIKQNRFVLSEACSSALMHEAHKAYQTDTQDLLLLISALALKSSGMFEHVYIELENHGRNTLEGAQARHIDVSGTLGWFTSMYPVLIELKEEALQTADFDYLIKYLKTNLKKIPDKGLSYFPLKYLSNDKNVRETLNQVPNPEIAFNYLGQLTQIEEDGTLSVDSEYLEQDLSVIQDSSPKNHSSHHASISVLFRDGKFYISVNYDKAFVDESKVEVFSQEFERIADALVEFCADEQHFGFTPEDLPFSELNQDQIDHLCHLYSAQPGSRLETLYPLSPMQEGMLFHSRMDNESGMYCEQVSVLFSGQLNIPAMEAAWNAAIQNHDILRSSFVWEDLPRPLQMVQRNAKLNIVLLDWREEGDIEKKLDGFLSEDRSKGFNFAHAPLMRLYYILLPSEHSGQILGRFIWSYHHILLDGWSMPLLMKEIFERYNDLCTSGTQKPVDPSTANYQQYIYWLYQQDSEKENHFVKRRDQFWQNYLAGFEEPSSLGISKKTNNLNPEVVGIRFQEQARTLSADETEALQAFASKHHITLNTLFQAAWALLLHRYSGEEDVVFGITVSGRPAELNGVESIVGLFINTVPFRLRVDGETQLSDWLQDILKNQTELKQFESSPLVDIQAQSSVDASRALFDSILVFENYPLDDTIQNSPYGLEIEDLKVYEQTNFPLSLIVLPGQTLEIRMLFDSLQFETKTIDSVLGHLKTILLELIDETQVSRRLHTIDYLGEKERHKIIREWNNTSSDYPRFSYLQDIVSQQNPENLALQSKTGALTYGELEEKANRLANYLCSALESEHLVKPGNKVLVCLNRSNELIISILAILKCGASYVPLDPAYPEERQRYMIEDTQTHLILTDSENRSLVKHLCAHKTLSNLIAYVDIESEKEEIAQQDPALQKNLKPYSQNQDVPAAILYTSGSTGQPKGVCLTHHGLSRMVMNTNYMQLNEQDKIAHVSNICFDAASFEIWSALLNGLPLVIMEKDILLDLVLFEKKLKEENVTILLIATALFNLVAKERVSAFSDLRYLFFGGEACNAGMVKRVIDLAKPMHLMHMYGPSENSTYATWYEVKEVPEDVKSIPIGRAVSNSQVYIMNPRGDLLPPGVAGEIVCAGDGLALGYLNKPEQTQKAFVMRNLPGQEPERMYLTGDMGVCLPDGNIEILGRLDNQVKIRGHRIEPEEVIARLNALENIKKAYVLVKQDNEEKKYLLAYFVPEDSWLMQQTDAQQRTRELKLKLKALMPDYMVPSFYVEIDELPLTPNGKIDTKALPEADLMQAASVYQAPENDLEENLVSIWEEVLGQPRIGVNDDFFELGGHSLLATQIHSRIRQQLNIDIPLRTLFELPTIREFSEFWQALSANQLPDSEMDDEEFEEGEL